MKLKTLFIIFGIISAMLIILATYSNIQIEILKKPHEIFSGVHTTNVIFDSPEDGMNKMIEMGYSGIQKTEIVHSGLESFNNHWFVEAYVWANKRSDGTTINNYDNLGWSYLRVKKGWIFIGGGEIKAFILSLSKWLFCIDK